MMAEFLLTRALRGNWFLQQRLQLLAELLILIILELCSLPFAYIP